MGCLSGKRQYASKALAEEALIGNRSRFVHRDASGPIGVYLCDDCAQWHLTSQGEKNPLLKDPDILKSIQKNQEAEFWERKFRK